MAAPPATCQYWSESDVGATFLQIWPSARSSALSGAMAALTDDPEASYWNPSALAFANRPQVLASAQNYLPGLYPGMYYTYATASVPLPERWLRGHNLALGLNNTWFKSGQYDVVDDSGRYIGTLPMYDEAVGIQAATRIVPWLGLGLAVKYIYQSAGVTWDVWGGSTYDASRTVAADVGALVKPWRPLSLGLTLANLGPRVSVLYHGYHDWDNTVSPPTTLRIGLCYSPKQGKDTNRVFCPRFMAQIDKVLVGMFSDSNHNLSVAQKLDSEWRSTWKAVGVELTEFGLASVRVGYFEDLANARGGIVLIPEEDPESYAGQERFSLTDAVFKPHPGMRLAGIGLTWGGGISYRNFQLDLSSDALVYDFPTADLMLSLSYRF